MKERRKYVRFPIITNAKYKLLPTPEVECRCKSRNVGGDGINIYTKEKLPVGKKIKLLFSLPDGTKEISAEGRIIWAKKIKGKVQNGIKFTKINKYAREKIIRYIQRCLSWED